MLSGLPGGEANASPAIVWNETAAGGELRVCGLPAASLAATGAARLAPALEVRAFDAGLASPPKDLPALWGAYQAEGGCLVFRPRHRPAPGMALHAAFRGEIFDRLAGTNGTKSQQLHLELAAAPSATEVAEIWPTGDTLPENQLRLYVTFSAPMSLKGIENNLRLRDAAGDEIADAFVDVPGGLWDPGRRRLTLILHPGRVKSGIAIGEQMGKVLTKGQEIHLEIGPQARDAEGAPLREGRSCTWTIGPPQTGALDSARFRLDVGPGDRAPLEIEAPVPLDRALALTSFAVRHGERELSGHLEVEPGERRLRFHPDQPWHRGQSHTLEIGPQLEDAAGNRLGASFERDPTRPVETEGARISFTP